MVDFRQGRILALDLIDCTSAVAVCSTLGNTASVCWLSRKIEHVFFGVAQLMSRNGRKVHLL